MPNFPHFVFFIRRSKTPLKPCVFSQTARSCDLHCTILYKKFLNDSFGRIHIIQVVDYFEGSLA